MSKIIFLDIDGVLNCSEGLSKMYKSKGASLKSKSICPDNILNFQTLLDREPDAKIVISSTWRIGFKHGIHNQNISGETWSSLLGEQIADRIIGMTHRSKRSKERGVEIDEWVKENDECCSFVIIDDDSDMLDSQLPNFIHTSWARGFEKTHIDRCIAILNK